MVQSKQVKSEQSADGVHMGSTIGARFSQFLRSHLQRYGHGLIVHGLVTTLSFCATFGFASLASAQITNASPGLIDTPVAFGVSQSGAASYQVPLKLPPGVANMAPKLALTYNSQGGNGMLGVGWALSGLSSITRCAATRAQDGVTGGGVNFDTNDKFCLDGQRLMLVPGTGAYGASGSEYRTEIDSFSKIVANGSAGSGPAYFIVKTKSGLTMEYGNTADSRIEAVKFNPSATWTSGTARAWAQNKITDLAGNYLTATYDEDTVNGTYYPARIDYTGNATSSPVLATSASVQFFTDTSRLDAIAGYSAGAVFKSTKRVNAIRTYVGASLVKEYRLAYGAQSTALDKSKLASITECDVAGVCQSPVSLAWGGAGTDGFAAVNTWLSSQYGTGTWTDNNLYPRMLVDVNGDGLPDIVGFGPQGVYVAINAGNNTFNTPSYALSNQFSVAQGYADNNTAPRFLVDVNADGLPDIVGFHANGVYVSLNNGNGTFAAPQLVLANQFGPNQGFADNSVNPRQLIDVNGDGLPDIVGFDASGPNVAINNGNGFNAPTHWITGQFGTSQGWGNNLTAPRFLVDINGDGLPDIVGFANGAVTVALNTGGGFSIPVAGSANYACAPGQTASGTTCFSPSYSAVNYSCPSGGTLVTNDPNSPTPYCDGGTVTHNNNPVYFPLSTYYTLRYLVDVNGDGLPDIVSFTPDGVMVSINTGAGFAAPALWLGGQFSLSQGYADNDVAPRYLIDVNGDGLPDIVGFSATGVVVSTNNGAGFNQPVPWVGNFGTSAGNWVNNTVNPRFVVDLNGDGLPDVIGFDGTNVVAATNNRAVTGNFVASVTSSLGAITTATYSPLTSQPSGSVYTKDTAGNAAGYPLVDVVAPFYVVSSATSSNDIGGTTTANYTYGGLKADQANGRGMLGFRWVKSHDHETGIDHYTEYHQDWPYVGMPSLSETRLLYAGNAGVIKRTTVTPGCQIPRTAASCAVAAGNSYFPYVASTVESAWDLNGAVLPVTTSSYTYGQPTQFGDPTQVVVGTDDGLSKTTTNVFTAADTTNWIAPRLQQTSVLSAAPSGNITRTNQYTYDARGLVYQETQEPGTPNYCLQTTYLYDSFGNRSSTSAAACAGATAPTITSAATPRTSTNSFGADGYFPVSSTNALLQSESRVYDYRFGTPTSLTGPNGLTTGWSYDTFGRKTQEVRADGTSTTWSYKACANDCPISVAGAVPKWYVIEQSYGAGTPGAGGVPTTSTTVSSPEKRQFFDALNHVVRVQTQGFDGAGAAPTLVQDTQYDTLGRISQQSNLYDLAGGTPVWTSYTYDALGRTTSESHPDSVATGGVATTTTTYNGLSTTVQNAAGQTKTTTLNAQGRVASVTDAQWSQVTYSYDAWGNLLSTNASQSVTAMQYDLRGRKIAMQDPAMGSWTYSYNAFGELVSQRDSLNQTTTMSYDVLGRMTQRLEPDLNSQWSYDTKFDGTACIKSVGKLCEAKTDNGYNRKVTFDAVGRVSSTAIVLDSVASPATLSQTYDSAGRVSVKTWPTGYQATYSYTPLGYLLAVNGGGTNGFTQTTSYQVQAMDAAGHVTQYKLGGKVTHVKSYTPDTQRLSAQVATTDGQASGNVMNQSYSYDALGNLTTRNDNAPGVGTQESFSYDSLNRLTLSTILGGSVSPPTTTQVMYDTRGNIAYRSDVGRYWYDGARPNRMTNVTLETNPGATVSLTGTQALSYAFDDANAGAQTVGGTTLGNGNLTYTVTNDAVNHRQFVRYESYTSFNMPAGFTYSNLVTNNYCLLPGYTLDATTGQCTLTTTSTIPATKVGYKCSANGPTQSGSTCPTVSIVGPVTATPNYACPAGYSPPTGSTSCSITTTYVATATTVCPSPGTWMLTDENGLQCGFMSGGHNDNVTWVATYVSYSCPSGGSLSGTTCYVTSYKSAYVAFYTYSCAAGQNVDATNTNCTVTTYPAAQPVYTCSTGQLNNNTCIITSTVSMPPSSYNFSDRTLTFVYGPEHQRIKSNLVLSGNGTSSYFAGNTWYLNGESGLDLAYEKEIRANGTVENRHYITADGQAFALFTSRTGTLNGLTATSTNYLLHDHLGSISVVADETGAVTERLAYDPWGKRRNINTLPGTPDSLDRLVAVATKRGYTEHEHFDEVGVVHMNGRVYDPLVGRFMSADPHVTYPYDLQSFNRYSYVLNNPLVFTDPTGLDAWAHENPNGTTSYNPTAHGQGIWGKGNSKVVSAPADPNKLNIVNTFAKLVPEAQTGSAMQDPYGTIYSALPADLKDLIQKIVDYPGMPGFDIKIGIIGSIKLEKEVEGILQGIKEVNKGFGELEKASELGVQEYRVLKKAALEAGDERHHLYEKRFADTLGEKPREMLSVVATKEEHQEFTNAWRAAISYGEGTLNATVDKIQDTARQIYEGYPAILRALGLK
ncbi:FG-GAP-like repeat-containing protein [Rhodoferax sp. GW822-FHT02A01]|uniref:FG-GAP-like repeat-containing protein n=1 Tax=Rhodoferax sp. GW822-FHT02A01 TaxID=3141537 RepID=UPI00315CCF1B